MAGEATVQRTTAEPDVSLPAAALGGAYLGGGNVVALRRAGLVGQPRSLVFGEAQPEFLIVQVE